MDKRRVRVDKKKACEKLMLSLDKTICSLKDINCN